MIQNTIINEVQEYSYFFFYPFKKTRKIKLNKIEDSIPVRAVWASDDEECKKETQLRYLKRVKGFERELEFTFDGVHNDVTR